MFRKEKIDRLDDFFVELTNRSRKGIYFYRINNYSEDIEEFLKTYMEKAKLRGVVIAGKIQNPDEKQLEYYNEIMGMDFSMDKPFLHNALKKWLPRLDDKQRENVVNSLYNTLYKMREAGKNDNMLKNAYIKFMCWFYYRFERILKQLGQEELPKILYEGCMSHYELKMLCILAEAGCDIVLLQHDQDKAYLSIDPHTEESQLYDSPGCQPIPDWFTIEYLRKSVENKARLARLYKEELTRLPGTNTWLSGDLHSDSCKPCEERGQNPGLIYNMFVRITGVEDKVTYCSDLLHWKLDLENKGKNVSVLENVPVPGVNEVALFNKNNYSNMEQLLMDMTGKLKCSISMELENQGKKAFAELLLEESERDAGNLNKIKSKAVYLLCWFARYDKQLFRNYKNGSIAVLFYFGSCKNNFEALFMKFLSKLPLDVILINPDLSAACELEDKVLFDRHYENSLKIEKFPENPGDVEYGTVAFHAEQELTELMYQDSGLYRNQQYKKAVVVSLQTMYEEMYLLWDQEVKYRPNFEVLDDKVVLPVMMTKISGVKDGNVIEYWKDIKKLIADDSRVITKLPFYIDPEGGAESSTAFLQNKKLLKQKIKNHAGYRYGIFREETQDYILDKLQELLDSGFLKGTYSQGVEYTIISVVLSMDIELAKLIQKIDFTKKLPKLIFVCTNEQVFSLKDSILIAYLHLAGFDIVMFVPTGFQLIEKHYTKPLFFEHQTGEYMFDLRMPDFSKAIHNSRSREGILNRIFRKG